MKERSQETQKNNKKAQQSFAWMKYAGMAAQFFGSIAVGVVLGRQIDAWAGFRDPWFVWLLPLGIILALLIHLIKETNRKS